LRRFSNRTLNFQKASADANEYLKKLASKSWTRIPGLPFY